jgi:hypothetical protein
MYAIMHDGQPFSIVEDRGFVKLAQTFIDIGAKYENVDVNSILNDRTSLSKTHLPNIFNAKGDGLKQNLTPVQFAGVTTD